MSVLQAQNLQWTANYIDPASGGDDQGVCVATDSINNIYTTGFGTGPYSKDFVTIKYNSQGKRMWVAITDGKDKLDDKAAYVAIDSKGNSYVTGYTTTSAKGTDFLTVKYDSSGVKLWEVTYNGTANSNDYAISIKVDSTGVYVAGHSSNSGNFNDFTLIKYNFSGIQLWAVTYHISGDYVTAMALDKMSNIYITGYTSTNCLTVKYDKQGNFQWAQSYSGTGGQDDYGNAITVDDNQNVYVAGTVSNSSNDYLILKYNTAGVQKWVATYNYGGTTDRAFSIAVDKQGNVFVGGHSFVSATTDCIVVKYDSIGIKKWEGMYSPTNFNDVNHSLFIDKNSNVYITGYTFINNNVTDCHLVKFDNSTGAQLWARQYNGAGNGYDEGAMVILDSNDDPIVVGFTESIYLKDEQVLLKYDPSGNLQWERTFSEPGNQSDGIGAAVIDSAENIYVPALIGGNRNLVIKYDAAGNEKWASAHTFTGGTGIGTSNLVLNSNGVALAGNYLAPKLEFHIIRYDSNGTKLWAVKYNSSLETYAYHLARDFKGNFYVGGQIGNGNAKDFLLVKYDGSGNQKWVKTFDAAGEADFITEVFTDRFGNITVLGESHVNTLIDQVIIKYDSLGNQLWKYTFSTNSGSAGSQHMKVDENGNVFLGTQWNNTNQNLECVVLKIDSSGLKQWERHYLGTQNKSSRSNVVDIDSICNVYVFCTTWLSNGVPTSHLLKYDNKGVFLWDVIIEVGTWDLTIDRWGMPYLSGELNGSKVGCDLLDGFVHKYDQYGTKQWSSASFNGKFSSEDRFYNVSVSSTGTIIVTGREQFEPPSNCFTNYHVVVGKYSNSNTTVGINNHKEIEESRVLVSPNPAKTFLKFELLGELSQSKMKKLVVLDITGRKVTEQAVFTSPFMMNCENLKPGLYLYTISGNDEMPFSGKFVVE